MPRLCPASLLASVVLTAFGIFGCKNDESSSPAEADSTSTTSGGSKGQGGAVSSGSDSSFHSTRSSEVGQSGAAASLGGSQVNDEATHAGGRRESSSMIPAGGGWSSGSSGKSESSVFSGGAKASGSSTTGGRSGTLDGNGSGRPSIGGATTAGANVGGNVNAGGTKSSSTKASSTASDGVTPVTLWIAGDSTVQTCSSACPCGWGGPFSTYFNANVIVNNQALGGRSIQTWMYEPNVGSTKDATGECTTQETNSTRYSTVVNGIKSGDYLFIQFGINDGDTNCPRHVGTGRYETLLTRLAKSRSTRGLIRFCLPPLA